MDAELLIRTFPRIYHMAHIDAWDGIARHGLLSTSALLDLFEIQGPRRLAIESCRRPQNVLIEHPVHGRAVIRDNKPMDDVGLRRALRGIDPEGWYRLLNGKVFFWLTESRLSTLLAAGAYRSESHCVIVVRTRELLERHSDRVSLCPMNSGCTKPFPHPRSPQIFQHIADYPFDHWSSKRGSAIKAVVELAIDYDVSDLRDFVQTVSIRNKDGIVREMIRNGS